MRSKTLPLRGCGGGLGSGAVAGDGVGSGAVAGGPPGGVGSGTAAGGGEGYSKVPLRHSLRLTGGCCGSAESPLGFRRGSPSRRWSSGRPWPLHATEQKCVSGGSVPGIDCEQRL